MKEFFKMFFACLLAMSIGGFLIFVTVVGIISGIAKLVTENENKVVTGNVLAIDLSKRFHEQGEKNSFSSFDKSSPYEAGLYDIVKAVARAKNDASIKGIYLKLDHSPNGWASLQQIRWALEDFKTSNKFIYAYGEDIPQNAYFVASVADSIFLNPTGEIELKGFATVLAYFKGTLEKLDLQPEIFYAGKFKSATEPFRADRISDPNKEQIMAFQKSMWDQFLTGAASYMQCNKSLVNKLAETGAIQFPTDAVKNKMVAGLLYWDQVEKRIKQKAGLAGSAEIKFVTIDDYAHQPSSETKLTKDKIALLVAEGEIVDGEQENEHQIASKTFCKQIRKLRDDASIKAVVLRVNSPGGSARASEVILRELNLLKQQKPIIVSMSDYAASGGYFIASLADSIFVMPNTITGSIGVFSMMFNIGPMMHNKLGVTFDEVKNAPYADLPSAFRPLTAEEARRMQASVDTIYNLFKTHVATARNMSMARVDSIAQGRVWTGTDAIKIGLADGVGGLGRSLKSAAAKAKITDYRVVVYPEAFDKFSEMLKKIKSNANASAQEVVKAAVKEEIGSEDFEWFERLQSYKKNSGKAMMELPFVMNVN